MALIGTKILSKAYNDTDYISVSWAKSHLRVTHTLDDAYISDLISAVIGIASNYVGYNLTKCVTKRIFDSLVGIEQGVNIGAISAFSLNGAWLRLNTKIISIDSVQYIDSNQVAHNLGYVNNQSNEPSNYCTSLMINSSDASLTDAAGKFVVTAIEGWDLTEFPKEIKLACALLLNQYYDNRMDLIIGTIVQDLPNGAKSILDNYKIRPFS